MNDGAKVKRKAWTQYNYDGKATHVELVAWNAAWEQALEAAAEVAAKAGQSGYVPWMGQNDWRHGVRDATSAVERLKYHE